MLSCALMSGPGRAAALTGNTPITINAAAGVLANDMDPDSSTPLSNVGLTAVSLNTAGTLGAVAHQPNGSFTYTPPTSFTGADTFRHTARDATNLNRIVNRTTIGGSGSAPASSAFA